MIATAALGGLWLIEKKKQAALILLVISQQKALKTKQDELERAQFDPNVIRSNIVQYASFGD